MSAGRYVLLFFALLFFSQLINMQNANGNTSKRHLTNEKVCYLPFSSETYIPITRENIEKHSWCKNFSSNSRVVLVLKGLLRNSKSAPNVKLHFDDLRVRVMLRDARGSVFYIDKNGVVYFSGKLLLLRDWKKDALELILGCELIPR